LNNLPDWTNIEECIALYESEKCEELCTRSQNIIRDLGGIEQLLGFYTKHQSFSGIRNVGKKSNIELVSFCKFLLSKREFLLRLLDFV